MIDFRIKDLFFDRQAVVRAVDKARRAALSKAGAFIRTTAKDSIRTRKGSAPPGKPPHSHTGLLRRFIFFGYDPGTDSVVVGPARINRTTGAPHILEFGGVVVAKKPVLVPVGNAGRDRKGRLTARRLKRIPAGTHLKYEPRPFMGPALEKERPNLPKPWANSVRGG